LGSAGIYAGAQRYGTDVTARTAAERLAAERGWNLSRAEQMQIAAEERASREAQARWGAYGRAQNRNARWARSTY
jgi:hypothetical protein